MPPLLGFSDNPFRTHNDFKLSCISLLRGLKPYQSPGGARIRLPLATGTHFDDIAAQLEGFARPLWAIGTLLHHDMLTKDEHQELADPYIRGLANGTDPSHPEYWGPVVLRDQRMVEMEIISFALLAAPDAMFHSQTPKAQHNIKEWLNTLNGKDFPVTNWLWFRVMTNLALVKVCGMPFEEVKNLMGDDLDQMEKFYLSEGWAADGIWSPDCRQADYYSGSFAIQFSQLLYSKMASDLDPLRCEKFRDRARQFAANFWRYFDENGAAIPFGRSLTYRFAIAGFWAAAAFAEVDLPAPVNDWGVVKGLLLRHFRWWGTKHDVFNVDGTLTIGFAYPNMYMCEDYNSPQSPYWAMKSFVALGLPETHPFWRSEEKVLSDDSKSAAVMVKPPMHILCNSGSHHFLLSAGQFCPWPLKATEAKYGKFAYSSQFGFSVPTGLLMPQMAPDSTLALSKDGGDIWRVPWKVSSYGFSKAYHRRDKETVEEIPALTSTWKPWKDAEIEVNTTLVAPSARWPNWYIRAHKVLNRGQTETQLLGVQGGFAIQGRGSKAGEVLTAYSSVMGLATKRSAVFIEGTFNSVDSALVCSDTGASGITSINIGSADPTEASVDNARAEVLKPDANTNLIWQRTLIPTVAVEARRLKPNSSIAFATAVFSAARREGKVAEYDTLDIGKLWEDVPVLSVGVESGDYLAIDTI